MTEIEKFEKEILDKIKSDNTLREEEFKQDETEEFWWHVLIRLNSAFNGILHELQRISFPFEIAERILWKRDSYKEAYNFLQHKLGRENLVGELEKEIKKKDKIINKLICPSMVCGEGEFPTLSYGPFNIVLNNVTKDTSIKDVKDGFLEQINILGYDVKTDKDVSNE